MKKHPVLLLIALLAALPLIAQKSALRPVVRKAVYFDVSPPLREMFQVEPTRDPEGLNEVPNKVGHREFNRLKTNGMPFAEDKVWQKQDGTRMPLNASLLISWDAINNLSGVYPPDTQGDVGPTHYVQVVNKKFAVYSKTNALLLGPSDLSTIWSGIPAPWNGTNNGDPVVLYDQAANRWMITQFSLPNSTQYAELVAISQTSDPTGSWYRYVFEYGSKMPDYPKLAVWPDGYYMSVNQFQGGADWAGAGASAFDRTKMLAGDPTASMVYFDLGATSDPGSMLPSDWDGVTPPVTGEPNYFIYYNDWTSATDDYLKIWSFHVDWTTPSNSTFAETGSLVTSPFDSEICDAYRGRCITQPVTAIKLESLSDRLMYRLQYRNFGTHRSMVTNHTVDVDGSGRAGIRWYELRNTGSGWAIYQQGTYSPDGLNRWMGSIAMNSIGAIALGYSVSDATSVYPSIRFTGRLANDGPGLMTIPEQNIISGTGYQSGSACRWGDYSMMSVDPSNDLDFWYTNEYILSSGSAPWRTYIASFKFFNVPSATTLTATNVTETTATLNGNISANGFSTLYHFEWGTTTAYGTSSPAISAGSGNAILAVSENLTGLTPGLIYHYRVVGVNSEGTANGDDFTVGAGLPVVNTIQASDITPTSATTGGTVVIEGGVNVENRGVCYGTGTSPVVSGPHTSDGSGTGSYASTLNGLIPNTTYYYRAYATNQTGTVYGSQYTLTTPCSAISSFPWTEGFENAGTIPACWKQEQVDYSGVSWVFITGNGTGNPATAHTGTYNACLKDASTADNKTRLITPVLDLTLLPNPQLKFWHTQAVSSTRQDQLEVYYKTSLAGTWTLLASYTTSITAWTQRTLALPNPSPTYYIAFVGNAKNGRGVCIDDVEVSSTCSTIYPASVTINASTNPVPPGNFVTMTAVPVNGGTTPAFQWKVNGISQGPGNPFVYIPSNADMVTCTLSSSETCAVPNPVASNAIILLVTTAPASQTLSNLTITGPACYDALQTIQVAGDGSTFTVQPGGIVTLVAGQKIIISPITSILPGSYLHGYIAPVGPFCQLTDNRFAAGLTPGKNEAGSLLNVFPNPTSDAFTLELKPGGERTVWIAEVYDMNGQRIMAKEITMNRPCRFSLEGRPAGIYLVRLAGAGETGTARIVLQK